MITAILNKSGVTVAIVHHHTRGLQFDSSRYVTQQSSVHLRFFMSIFIASRLRHGLTMGQIGKATFVYFF